MAVQEVTNVLGLWMYFRHLSVSVLTLAGIKDTVGELVVLSVVAPPSVTLFIMAK